MWTLIWRARAVEGQLAERRYALSCDDVTEGQDSASDSDPELEVWESELAWLRSCLRGSGLILLDGAYAGETE